MKGLRGALLIGTLLLGACAPVSKAREVPRPSNLPKMLAKAKPSPEMPKRKPVQKIVDGKTTYSLQGNALRISVNGKTMPSMGLGDTFREAKIDQEKAEMRLDGFPPKMKREGRLLYVYSPGAKGVVVACPETDQATWIEVSEKITSLRDVSRGFDVRNGIIAITGRGADFIGIVSLGNLLNYEAHPVIMGLDRVLAKTGYRSLIDPKVEIKGNRIYITDDALGKGRRFFYEVVKGIPLPFIIEAEG